MSTAAICVIAVCALLAFGSLVQAVKEVLVAQAQPPACPCRDLHSLTLTPETVVELPPGTELQPGTAPGMHRDVADIRSVSSPDDERAPRMSEYELMGLYEDLAKVDRLRASGKHHELVRARELHALVVEQAAAPARKVH